MYIDPKKVLPHYDEIYYMLGQLQEVHQGNRSLTFGKGTLDYKNNKWSKNNTSLYALYYLGLASHCMTGFNICDGKISSNFFKCIQPTFFPPVKKDREPGDD